MSEFKLGLNNNKSMTYSVKLTFLSAFTFLLSACASPPTEQFTESFFTYESEQGVKYFSFILKLKGMYRPQEQVVFERVAGRKSGKGATGNRKTVKQRVPRPENPEDVNVSLKFRMEEMAHTKLETKLKAINYCPSEVKYEIEEYTDFQYKIKGFCVIDKTS